MDGGSDNDEVLGKWIKKNLEAGDDPEVIKAALKNQGHDPNLVDVVLASGFRKKIAPPKNAAETEFYNSELKSEVDSLMAEKPEPAKNEEKILPVAENHNHAPKKHLAESFKLPRFKFRLPQLPKFDFDVPEIKFPKPSLDSIKWIMISVFILIVLFAIFYGLNWYADRAAKAVLQ